MIKIKTKKHYFLLISTFLFIYVFFNLLDGERGLISYFEKREMYQNLIIEKKNLVNQITDTENKISLLIDLTSENSYLYDKSKNIDLDYIEILIRDSFFYGKPGEKVYLINNNEN